jgi:hypothetical protein
MRRPRGGPAIAGVAVSENKLVLLHRSYDGLNCDYGSVSNMFNPHNRRHVWTFSRLQAQNWL